MLGDKTCSDIGTLVDRPRSQRVFPTRVTSLKRRNEAGVSPASPGASIIGGEAGPVQSGTAKTIRRDGRLQGDACNGVVQRILHDNPATHAPAHKVDGPKSQLTDHRVDIVAEVAHSPACIYGSTLAAAEAAQIYGISVNIIWQGQHDRLPEQ